jgi:DNA polymerase-3 subunit gamma/tau
VLARCLLFVLRRVAAATLAVHFAAVAEKENAEIEPGAIRLIARAADGSVRDGLSLLDQAIAHGAGAVGEDEVRDMLGLADRARVFELFAAVMKGESAAALDLLGEQYRAGADPIILLEDMLELTHWLTRVKLVPAVADEPGVAEIERRQGQEMATKLAMPELTRAWQMLLKGLSEARAAPHPLMAVEMALVRLAYAADLPSPADALRALEGAPAKPAPTKATASPPPPPPTPVAAEPPPDTGGGQTALAEERAPEQVLPAEQQPEAEGGETTSNEAPGGDITSLADIAALAAQHREVDLRHWLVSDIHLVRLSPGHIELRQNDIVLKPMAGELSEKLQTWTGRRWMVALTDEAGEPTLEEQAEAIATAKLRAAEDDPLVRQVLKIFPDAEISGLRESAESDDNE